MISELHRLRALQFLILLRELVQLRLERYVRLTEQLDGVARRAQQDKITIRIQLASVRIFHQLPVQLIAQRLHLRQNLFHELQICLLRLGIIRGAGHGNVAARTFLFHHRPEFIRIQ